MSSRGILWRINETEQMLGPSLSVGGLIAFVKAEWALLRLGELPYPTRSRLTPFAP